MGLAGGVEVGQVVCGGDWIRHYSVGVFGLQKGSLSSNMRADAGMIAP
jgi:hypothetical protein